MKPRSYFRFCPSCGAPSDAVREGNVFRCAACPFHYYFNPAVAAAVFILNDDGCVLLIRRAWDPGRGLLAPPGGFIDIGERAEVAVRREIREEIGLELDGVTFLCSQTNEYSYRDVTYPVLDLFFTARVSGLTRFHLSGEVAEVVWTPASNVEEDRLAFPSMRAAWRFYRGQEPERDRPIGD